MRDGYVIKRRSEVRYRQNPRQLSDNLEEPCAATGVKFDAESKVGYKKIQGDEVLFSWSIAVDEGGYVVTQDQWVPKHRISEIFWRAILVFYLYALIVIGQTFQSLTLTLDLTLIVWAAAMLLSLLILLYDGLTGLDQSLMVDPVLADPDGKFSRYSFREPGRLLGRVSIFLWLLSPLFAYLGRPVVTFTAGTAGGIMICALWFLYSWDGGTALLTLSDRVPSKTVHLSTVPRQYLQYTFILTFLTATAPLITGNTASIIDWIFRADIDHSALEPTIERPFLDLVVLAGVLYVLLKLFLESDNPSRQYHSFSQMASRQPVGQFLDGVALLFSSILVYLALIKSISILLPFVPHILPRMLFSLPWTMTVGAMLPFVFPVSIYIRRRAYFSSIAEIVESGAKREISIDGFEAEILVVNTSKSGDFPRLSEYYATSFRFRGEDYIVLSAAFFDTDEINERAIAGIVAHERGHIKHGDTALSTWVHNVSMMLLVGQNALYGITDFYSREIEADRYAVEQVGYDAYSDALDFLLLHASTGDARQDFGANAAPSFDLSRYNGTVAKPFQLLFGNFALVDAHPNFETRKKKARPAEMQTEEKS